MADEAAAAEVPLPVNQGGMRIGFSAGFAAEVLPVDQGDAGEGFAAEVLPVDLGDARKGFAAEVLPVNLWDARKGFAAEVLTTMPSDEGDTTTMPPDKGDGMTIPPDEGDGTVMLPDEGDGTAMPSDKGDTKMISPDKGDTTTTMIKSGFKEKCTNKKFRGYGKRGGDRKRNYTPSDNPTNLLSEWAHIKLTNDARTTTGGHCEWLLHVDKLILEMLANHTPPTCIV